MSVVKYKVQKHRNIFFITYSLIVIAFQKLLLPCSRLQLPVPANLYVKKTPFSLPDNRLQHSGEKASVINIYNCTAIFVQMYTYLLELIQGYWNKRALMGFVFMRIKTVTVNQYSNWYWIIKSHISNTHYHVYKHNFSCHILMFYILTEIMTMSDNIT